MPQNELLDIVDDNDNVIGQDTKTNKQKHGLISRNVVVFLIDDKNRLLLAKRSLTKKHFPGRFDPAAVGNVLAGESYEEAAMRELKEELNVTCRLRLLKKTFNDFSQHYKRLRYFTGIFLGNYSGEVVLNHELDEIRRLTIVEIEDLIRKDKDMFTPGFLSDFLSMKDQLK